ncbi:hypothetical protein TeGR_g1395, partial [Tetraparma gracilis]
MISTTVICHTSPACKIKHLCLHPSLPLLLCSTEPTSSCGPLTTVTDLETSSQLLSLPCPPPSHPLHHSAVHSLIFLDAASLRSLHSISTPRAERPLPRVLLGTDRGIIVHSLPPDPSTSSLVPNADLRLPSPPPSLSLCPLTADLLAFSTPLDPTVKFLDLANGILVQTLNAPPPRSSRAP